ncbi:hypothetical protein DV515_00011058 [Chloebia gouldiae]|uniref:Uncharacterized protein n=1 Tax=Chloebia gouldiae TaxID=44316 RepID=A0A3L8S835_CHLGU|nr:hypothetical protein DV515_00011058 [Chloebia gouldiae]
MAAAEAAEWPLMRRYEGAAQGLGVAADGWRVCLAHSFEELRQPYGAGDVPLRDVLRHVGLALRYGGGWREPGTHRDEGGRPAGDTALRWNHSVPRRPRPLGGTGDVPVYESGGSRKAPGWREPPSHRPEAPAVSSLPGAGAGSNWC